MSKKDNRKASPEADESQSNQVQIRLPSGEHAWVSPETFNLISEKAFQESDELRRLRRHRNLAALGAAAALLLLVGGSLALVTQRSEAGVAATSAKLEQPVQGSASDGTPDASTAGPSNVASKAAPGTSSETASGASSIEETVRAWARAWASQDVDAYLGFYARQFQTPNGRERSDWEAERRERILRPGKIEVAVGTIETTLEGDERAEARFGQAYRATGYRDWVLKSLELVYEDGGWKILAESSSPLPVSDESGLEASES